MVELTEVQDGRTTTKTTVVNASYRGPGDDFPYMGLQVLGATHILLAVAMMIAAIVHMALTDWDREYFLLSGSVSIWCPIAALATGIVGATISESRYWEVRCLKQAFLGLNLVTGLLFMVTMAVVTGLVDFHYYDMSDLTPVETFADPLESESDNRVAMLWVIVSLAILEFLVCMVSASVCLCCAPLYMEAEIAPEPAQQQQIIIRQQLPPPVYVEKTPAPPPPQPILVQRPAPPPPQPIYIQAPPQPPRPPIVMQAPPPPPPMIMPPPMPPPQPIYAQPSLVGIRRTVRRPNGNTNSGYCAQS